MTGTRMSALPLARFCGRAAGLNVGAGRAAALSTAFHAVCDGGGRSELAKLTPEERKTIAEWHKPTDIQVGEHWLRYAEASRELEVALTETGGHCAKGDPRAISVGHLDMAWTKDFGDKRVVYIADIKKTQWTTLDGPESLQLAAYAFAFGARMEADAYCCGIWQATEGQWDWGEIVDFDSVQAAETWEAIRFAAENTGGDFAMGPHCAGCYSKMRCPAYVFPPEHADSSLAPFVEGGIATQEKALSLLMLKQRAEATIERADEMLKTFAKTYGGIEDGKGKVWKPVASQGRESFDKKRLLEEHPEMASYTKRGPSFDTYRWTKAK